jgi:hypothetical protein
MGESLKWYDDKADTPLLQARQAAVLEAVECGEAVPRQRRHQRAIGG